MPAPDFVALFTVPLERLRLPYMITGATAAILYGQPRVTNDLDIVLELREADIEPLREAFSGGEFYVPPTEVIAVEVSRAQRGHLNLIHLATGYKADLYPVGQDPLHHWALPRRRRVAHGGGEIAFAPPEYVIVRKLEYYREGGSSKHITDVEAMLRVSGTQLDRGVLDAWIERLGLTEVWRQVRP